MLRTQKLIKYITSIKQNIKDQDVDDITTVKYSGSYTDKKKKWVSDVDIRVIIDDLDIINQIPLIRKIIKNNRDNPKCLYGEYLVGYEDYYYREKYSFPYIKKLYTQGTIDQDTLDQISTFFKPVYYHDYIKKILQKYLGVYISYTDVMKNTKKLKHYISKDNNLRVKFIFGYGKKYMQYDFIFITKNRYQQFVNTISLTDNLFLESLYNSGQYYYYLKRLKSRLMSIGKLTEGKKLKKLIIDQEEYISKNNQEQYQAMVNNDKEKLRLVQEELELYFKPLAIKYYKKRENEQKYKT
jgi:hypothetical protein